MAGVQMETEKVARASLWLGILGLSCFGVFCAIPAVI
jgi:hypothetical protein